MYIGSLRILFIALSECYYWLIIDRQALQLLDIKHSNLIRLVSLVLSNACCQESCKRFMVFYLSGLILARNLLLGKR